MSIESDYRALLAADAPLVGLVGNRIALSALPEGRKGGCVVFGAQHDYQRGLGGELHGDVCNLVTECWDATGEKAAAIADRVEAALATVPDKAMVTGRAPDFDEDTGLHGVVVSAVWIV